MRASLSKPRALSEAYSCSTVQKMLKCSSKKHFGKLFVVHLNVLVLHIDDTLAVVADSEDSNI